VRAGGVYLKRDYFDSHSDENRVYKDFGMGRTDQLGETMRSNADPWDWSRFQNDYRNNQ
jgi:hypothetical protein